MNKPAEAAKNAPAMRVKRAMHYTDKRKKKPSRLDKTLADATIRDVLIVQFQLACIGLAILAFCALVWFVWRGGMI